MGGRKRASKQRHQGGPSRKQQAAFVAAARERRMEAEIRMAPSRVSHVPEVTSATRSKLLTRIMRDQTTFLNTRTQPSADFGRGRRVLGVCVGAGVCGCVMEMARGTRTRIS